MIEKHDAERILTTIRSSRLEGNSLRKFAMEQISQLSGYNWSGIYRLEGQDLVLDEYVGAETDHTRIPIGRGVCGTAVATNANQIVADVRNLDNYLACSTQTRSEIVVLIRDESGTILGQIDIDGHEVGAFDASDEQFLTELADLLSKYWLPAASLK